MPLDEYGQPESPTDIGPTSDWFAAPDYHLQSLADSSDRFGNGFAVTLVTSGGLISGVMTSRRDFLRGSADVVRSIGAESGDENVIEFANDTAKDSFDDVAQIIDDELSAEFETIRNGGEPKMDVVPRVLMMRFIYLNHARFHQAGTPPIELGHMKVMLSQVTAWSMGRP